MSNDGNKSTKRVPFTMFSSSAGGGYLDDLHANFTDGVAIANMHTDTYGEFRNPPMQGPFTEAMVGGEQRRHVPVTNQLPLNRPEMFHLEVASEQIVIQKGSKTYPDSAEMLYDNSDGLSYPAGLDIDVSANLLVWADYNDSTILTSALDAPDPFTAIVAGASSPWSVSLDRTNQKVYWSQTAGVEIIRRSNYDGSSDEDVVTGIGDCYGIAVDTISNMIYWTDNGDGSIRRASLSSLPATHAGSEVVFSGFGAGTASEIVLDTTNQEVYWSNWDNSYKKIYKVSMSGGTPVEVASDVKAYGISLDLQYNKIYWTNRESSSIGFAFLERANLDGTEREALKTIASDEDKNANGVAIDPVGNRVYWCSSNASDQTVQRKFATTNPISAPYYRDEYAKRPVNIRNIKTNSPGNYNREYEVVQIASRTLNPRHYAEYSEQYTTDFPLHRGTEGRVLNTIDADGVVATGSLEEYTLPDITGSANNFIFVNKFSAPGDRYTMSRGFLNPKGEELSAYNASPFRNLNVRQENSENLTAHNEQFTAAYHPENRNTKFAKKDSAQNIQKIAVESASKAFTPDSFAIDHEAGYIYIATSGTKILRTDLDGNSSTQVLYDLGVGHYLRAIAIDTESGKMYFIDSTNADIYIANLDGTGTPSVLYSTTATSGNLRQLALDLINGKIYYSDNTPGSDGIFRYDIDGTSVSATPIVTGLDQPYGIAVDPELGRVYYTDLVAFTDGFIGVCGLNGEDPRTLATSTSPLGLSLDTKLQKIYWADDDDNTVSRMNTDGTDSEVVLSFSSTGFYGFRSVVLDAESGYLYFGNELSYPNASIERAPAPEKPIYDNANVTHAIPQSSLQYSWIKDSAETTRADFQGYATGSDIQFYSNSVGFDSPMNNVYIDPVNATQSFDFTGSAYTYGTWKEIRGGELALSRHYRENSILPVANNADKVTQYSEPAIVAKNQPLEYILAIDSTGTPYSIRSAYGSKLQRYSNEEINELYDIKASDADTKYEKIKPLYLERSVAEPNNPVKQFYSLTYGETVFPRSRNAYTKKVRIRGEYTEVAGTGVKGYDRRYGLQNTFYRSTGQRSEGALNSQGYAPSDSSAVTLSVNFAEGADWANYSHILGRDTTSGIVNDAVSGSNCFVFGNQNGHSFSRARYLSLKDPVIGDFTATFSMISGPYSELDMSGAANMSPADPTPKLALVARQKNGEIATYAFDEVQMSGPPVFEAKTLTDTFTSPTYITIQQVDNTYLGFSDSHLAIKDIVFNYTPASASSYQSFQPMGTDGDRSFNNSASFSSRVGELNSDTDITISQTDKQPSLSFFEETGLYLKEMSATFTETDTLPLVASGYTERLIEDISNKVPSQDTYEDYADDEKHITKEASILPEFRISEFVKRYVEVDGGNFRKENKDFLSILGVENSSSAPMTSSVNFDSDFEETYLITDEIGNYKKIREDHIGHSTPKRLTIRATGVKKLLPYNGFYPSTRAVQLGAELSSSISDGVSSYQYSENAAFLSESSPAPDSIGIFGLTKVMASPGILHNSIKGGIAVDYPSFTSSFDRKNDFTKNLTGDMSISSAPNLRIPFESLYNLDQYFPENKDIYVFGQSDKLQSGLDRPSYYFSWDGTKKPTYELAMHNYLSECVGFFLQNGSLNSFISSPEGEFLDVVANKKYYMDVVLDDATGNNKFINPKGTKEAFGSYADIVAENLDYNSRAGWDSDVSQAVNGGYYSIAGIPQFEGDGKAEFFYTDEDGNVTNLDPTNILAGSSESQFGYSVSVDSGSNGVFLCVGAPQKTSVGAGQVHMYRYQDSTGLVEMTNSPRTTPGSTNLGVAVKCLYSEGGGNLDKVFFAATDAENTNTSSGHRLTIYRSTNLTSATLALTGDTQDFDNTGNPMLATVRTTGLDMKLLDYVGAPASANNTLLIMTSTPYYSSAGNYGAVSGTYYDGTSFTSGFGPITDPSVDPTSGGWGADISFVETGNTGPASSVSYGYVAVGRSRPIGSAINPFPSIVTGSVGLYKVRLDESTGVQIQSSTELNGEVKTGHDTLTVISEDVSFGSRVGLDYDTNTGDLLLAATQPFFSWGTPSMVGGVRIAGSFEIQKFHKKDGNYVFPTSSLEYWTLPTFDANGVFTLFAAFGASLNTSYDGEKYLAAVGSPFYSGSFSAGGIAHVLYGSASYHDYKQDGKLFGMPIDGYYDPSYCAYTPPGFYGQSVARIAYSSSIGGKTSLDEIFSKAEVVESTTLVPSRQRHATGSTQTQLTSLQEESKMPMGASLSMFGKVFNPSMEFSVSEDGTTTRADRATNAGEKSPRWAISTKFEAPVINISSSKYEENYTSYNNDIDSAFPGIQAGTLSYDTPQSVWTSYSTSPTPENNYTLSLRESFTDAEATSLNAGSLIDLCGFTAGTRNIGSVAKKKQLKEAIMVIPYTSRAIKGKTTKIEEGMHFFKVGKRELNRQKRSMEDNGYAIDEDTISTSISEMISGMKEYVIPPQYNFLQYKDIDPFAAYFLQFEQSLDQRDLADIWQGVSPSIAINPEVDEVEITHKIDKHNLFYNIKIPNDIKFMIFKVKYKAEWNYYNVTTDSTDDDRFKFDFQGDGKAEVVPEYSYNWPYDYCSLVERAKVDVEFTFKKNGDDEDLPGEE